MDIVHEVYSVIEVCVCIHSRGGVHAWTITFKPSHTLTYALRTHTYIFTNIYHIYIRSIDSVCWMMVARNTNDCAGFLFLVKSLARLA